MQAACFPMLDDYYVVGIRQRYQSVLCISHASLTEHFLSNLHKFIVSMLSFCFLKCPVYISPTILPIIKSYYKFIGYTYHIVISYNML